jgi:ribosomal-protein-alanine N-acetyltransferase
MTNSDLLLRLAHPSEATAIAYLSRELIEYGLGWRWTPERIMASIRAVNTNVLVSAARQRIAGFGIMRYGDDDAHLDLLAVAPPYQRLGVGSEMVRWLEKCAIVGGTFRVALEVRAGNQGAQRFYQNLGYRICAELPGYYQGVEAALRMERDLSCRPSVQS